jgi:acetolactate synthase regulatory subunit
MGEIVCELKTPQNDGKPLYYNSYEIRSHLNAFKNMTKWEYRGNDVLNNYMEQNYGITDENILGKIYLKYYTILLTNILNDFNEYGPIPIDESVGNREDLLVNKISQYMLDDTEYYFHRDRVIIDYPSEGFNSYSIDRVLPILLRRGYDINFVNYVQSTYSIKDWNLITLISQRYYSLLYDKVKELLGSSNNTMNESVERKEEMFNKIVDFMIQDTTWFIFMENVDGTEEVRVEITFPSGDADEFPIDEMEVDWEQFFMNGSDIVYLEDQFGITEIWIIQELYNRYINKLRPIIYEEMVNYNK